LNILPRGALGELLNCLQSDFLGRHSLIIPDKSRVRQGRCCGRSRGAPAFICVHQRIAALRSHLSDLRMKPYSPQAQSQIPNRKSSIPGPPRMRPRRQETGPLLGLMIPHHEKGPAASLAAGPVHLPSGNVCYGCTAGFSFSHSAMKTFKSSMSTLPSPQPRRARGAQELPARCRRAFGSYPGCRSAS
jgi:hypothetical protein